MILPSGTEEYFNKKKTLNTKCWGIRAIALCPLSVLKNYSSCINYNIVLLNSSHELIYC